MDKHKPDVSLATWGSRMGALGVVQIAAGIATGNDTMLYAGIHNTVDKPIFHTRNHAHKAEVARDYTAAKRFRRIAAGGMLIVGLGLGAREIAATDEANNPSIFETVSLGTLAVTDAMINARAFYTYIIKHEKTGSIRDTVKHLAVDMSGSGLTLMGAIGVNYDPAYDKVGAIGHAGLLTAAAGMTIYDTRSSTSHDPEAHD